MSIKAKILALAGIMGTTPLANIQNSENTPPKDNSIQTETTVNTQNITEEKNDNNLFENTLNKLNGIKTSNQTSSETPSISPEVLTEIKTAIQQEMKDLKIMPADIAHLRGTKTPSPSYQQEPASSTERLTKINPIFNETAMSTDIDSLRGIKIAPPSRQQESAATQQEPASTIELLTAINPILDNAIKNSGMTQEEYIQSYRCRRITHMIDFKTKKDINETNAKKLKNLSRLSFEDYQTVQMFFICESITNAALRNYYSNDTSMDKILPGLSETIEHLESKHLSKDGMISIQQEDFNKLSNYILKEFEKFNPNFLAQTQKSYHQEKDNTLPTYKKLTDENIISIINSTDGFYPVTSTESFQKEIKEIPKYKQKLSQLKNEQVIKNSRIQSTR